jgi:hypothetical protein
MGGLVSIAGGATFALQLPKLRPAARELIIAQQIQAGAPAQEMTARVFGKS